MKNSRKNILRFVLVAAIVATECNIGGWNLFDYGEIVQAATADGNGFIIENGILKGYQGTEGDITIPDSVTSIAAGAFKNCSSLKSVTIPESVNIGDSAFENCSNLERVYVPISYKPYEENSGTYMRGNIGNYVFRGCGSLESFECHYISNIGKGMFYGCSNLKNIAIYGSNDIEEQAFEGCSSLETVNIFYLRYIRDSAFKDCISLTKVNIPFEIESIGDSAFEGCGSLEYIAIPDNMHIDDTYIQNIVINIGENVFNGCGNLRDIALPENVEGIGQNTFAMVNDNFKIYCHKNSYVHNYAEENGYSYVLEDDNVVKAMYSDLGFQNTDGLIIDNGILIGFDNDEFYKYYEGSLVIPDGVKGIGNSAFAGGIDAGKAEFPESITNIGECAFASCDNFVKIIMSNSVTSIGCGAFKKCVYLRDVTLPNGISIIEDSVFYNCNGLRRITIPDSVTDIGRSAFRECRSLADIAIPDNVTNIAEDAFLSTDKNFKIYCHSDSYAHSYAVKNGYNFVIVEGDVAEAMNSKLGVENIDEFVIENGMVTDYIGKGKAIEIPDEAVGIGDYALYFDTDLESVTIPNNIASIGNASFYGCKNLKNIFISNNVISIGNSSFSACRSLENITIPDSVEVIKEGAFEGCSSLKDIVIPNSVTIIENYVFGNCSSLENVVIPNSVTAIGSYAFSRCSSLENIIMPEGVTTISSGAFDNCTSLKSVTIPKSVITIESYSFSYCSSLENITIPEGVTTISSGAFDNCTSLKSMTIPKSVTTINGAIFNSVSETFKIYCYKDSYAHNYAEKNNYEYVLIDNDSDIATPVPEETLPPDIDDDVLPSTTPTNKPVITPSPIPEPISTEPPLASYPVHIDSDAISDMASVSPMPSPVITPSPTPKVTAKPTPVATLAPTPSADAEPTLFPSVSKEPELSKIPNDTSDSLADYDTQEPMQQPSGKLTFKKTKIILNKGQKAKIKITSELKTGVTYKSLDTSIAIVSKNGTVTAKKKGKTVIVVSANGKKKGINITVKKEVSTDEKTASSSSGIVRIDKDSKLSKTKIAIQKGKKFAIKKASGLSGKVTFRSLDKKIASVSVNGVVKAKKKGKTTILIKTAKKTLKLKVTVKR